MLQTKSTQGICSGEIKLQSHFHYVRCGTKDKTVAGGTAGRKDG